jgi:AcrR family transcriptional regulator
MFTSMARNGRTRAAHQLPPGRHGLPRSFVIQNQRERILAAVADATAAASYAGMSVEDVVKAAGVSRRTFYEHFKNKEDAFIAAYDAVVDQVVERVSEAIAGEAEHDFEGKLRAGLGTFLDFLASEPAFARMCVVEVLAAGPEAVKRRNDAMHAFTRLVEENARQLFPDAAAPGLSAETIVGGIYEVIHTRVLRGETDLLPGLLPDLSYSALLPYVGPRAATEARERLLAERATA